MNFEQAITQLQDTLFVVAEIQRRQAEGQKTQAEAMALHEQRMSHIDMRLARMTGKLDGLIGFNWRARPAKPSEDGQQPKQ